MCRFSVTGCLSSIRRATHSKPQGTQFATLTAALACNDSAVTRLLDILLYCTRLKHEGVEHSDEIRDSVMNPIDSDDGCYRDSGSVRLSIVTASSRVMAARRLCDARRDSLAEAEMSARRLKSFHKGNDQSLTSTLNLVTCHLDLLEVYALTIVT